MLYICRKSYLTFDGRSDHPERCGQAPSDPGDSGVVMEDRRADVDGQSCGRGAEDPAHSGKLCLSLLWFGLIAHVPL